MSEVEARTLRDKGIAPHTYCRYVDDIFVDVKDEEHLKALIDRLQANSVLKFTYELNIRDKLTFFRCTGDLEAQQI